MNKININADELAKTLVSDAKRNMSLAQESKTDLSETAAIIAYYAVNLTLLHLSRQGILQGNEGDINEAMDSLRKSMQKLLKMKPSGLPRI